MADKDITESSEKVEKNDQGDRTLEQTTNDAIVRDEQQQGVHSEAKLFENQNNLSDPALISPRPGESLEEFERRVEAIQNNRFGIFGLEEPPPPDPNDSMTTSEAIEFGGDDAIRMIEAIEDMPDGPEKLRAKEALKRAYTEVKEESIPTGYKSSEVIVANVIPNNPIKSDASLPNIEDVDKSHIPDEATAQGVWHRTRNDALRTDINRVAMPGIGDRVIFPFRGTEDLRLAECTKDNPAAWNDAMNSFPELNHRLPETGTLLMKALVRNELHHYDLKDGLGDAVSKYGLASSGETLGLSQIAPVGVERFSKDYPQLREFLELRGHKGKNAAESALRDPACTPMIVAAKLQSIIDFYHSTTDKLHPGKKVQINLKTLAYAYNADVYYNPKNHQNPDFHSGTWPKAKQMQKLRGYEKAYPTGDSRVLNISEHVKNVEQQMDLLR